MKKTVKIISIFFAIVLILSACVVPTFAANDTSAETVVSETTEETEKDDSTSAKAIAAAITIAVASAAGACAMGMAISKSVDGIARQPEAEGKIRTSLMLGLVFVETAIIYALIIAILIIFVL